VAILGTACSVVSKRASESVNSGEEPHHDVVLKTETTEPPLMGGS
jgi:hypothetical protein